MSKLYFRYGAMGSGKTSALLQVAYNYEQKGMHIVLIKPQIDTKGDNKVVSRIGLDREVDILLGADDKILQKMQPAKPDAIIVDEAQFLTPKQVDELYGITKEYDVPVLCYGLRADFRMQGFPGSTRLLQIADDIEELKTNGVGLKNVCERLRMFYDTENVMEITSEGPAMGTCITLLIPYEQ